MPTFKRACPAMRLPGPYPQRLPGMDRRRAARPVDVHRRPGKPAVARRTHGPPPAAVGQRLPPPCSRPATPPSSTPPSARPACRRRPSTPSSAGRRPPAAGSSNRSGASAIPSTSGPPPTSPTGRRCWSISRNTSRANRRPPSLRRRQTGRVARRLASARRRGLAARRPVPLLRQHRAASGRRRRAGRRWRSWVRALARRCGLRGLFGVDGVVRDGGFYPVEVNPRYTASVEVLEYAGGLSALAWHRSAFVASPRPAPSADAPTGCVGKAVYFAPRDLTFPADGPWADVLRSPPPSAGPPAFADIPHPGTHIKAGRPVLHLFREGRRRKSCLAALRRTAADLDRLPFDGPQP